jgi:deazaflavin-dependent oxidoreductase (nitroreductase family)
MLPAMSLGSTLFTTMLRVHAFVYERSGGAIGHRILGVPTLMLRSTGRRSGQVRTNALVYARDGGRWLIVPSNGGADRPPAWLHNLRAEPHAEIQVARTRTLVIATEVRHDDPEFARLWKVCNDGNGNRFAAYQRKTSREIGIVALAPR